MPDTLLLVRDRQPTAHLVLPRDAHSDETLAAQEIADHLEKITGVRVPILTANEKAKTLPIHLGRSAPQELLKRISGMDPAAFVLEATPVGISIVGNSPEGTLFGAYELLEQLGVRWFMPGDFGTILPSGNALRIRLGTTPQCPSFKSRHLQSVLQDDVSGIAGRWYRPACVSAAFGRPIWPAPASRKGTSEPWWVIA